MNHLLAISAKFQLNLSTQTTVTAAYLRLP